MSGTIGTLSVKNFEQFQHYKDRSPPWIKFYNSLLDDYEFGRLSDASKWHLAAIWLLASRYNNKIPDDAEWISKRTNSNCPIDLAALISSGFVIRNNEIQSASKPLAPRSEIAIPERERETEREAEAEAERNKKSVAAAAHEDHKILKAVGDRVVELAKIDPARWIGSYAPISGWLRNGAIPELDIYPTVANRAARPNYEPPRALTYFTDAIMCARQERLTDPPTPSRSYNVHSMQPKKSPELEAYILLARKWILGGKVGPRPLARDHGCEEEYRRYSERSVA